MKNYFKIGPLRVRVSSKHLAPWGYERVGIGGLSFFSRSSDGAMILASYMPKGQTWHWSFSVHKRKWPRGWIARDRLRTGQWHDYYRLPFGRELIISRQDFHKQTARRAVT